MCKHCEGECPVSIISVRLECEKTDVFVDLTEKCPDLTMETALGAWCACHSARINYCPMCGRDLRGGKR